MKKGLVIKIVTCVLVMGLCLYSHIEKENELTKLRIELPELAKKVQMIQEESTRFRYEIEQFENPQNLMRLARGGEFSHLKYPRSKEILLVDLGPSLKPADSVQDRRKAPSSFIADTAVAVGAFK